MSFIGELGMGGLLVIAILAVIGIFVLLKIAHHFYKAVVTGVFFAAIPFAGKFMGLGMSTDPASLVTFMLLGVSFYLTTHTMHIGLRIAKAVIGPFNRFFQEKDIRHKKIQRIKKN